MRYKVEPYVVAADVYSERTARRARRLDLVHRLGRLDVSRGPGVDSRLPHSGRDPAARSVRAAGVDGSSTSTFDYRGTHYEIAFENPHGVSKGLATLQLDGAELPTRPGLVPLVDDGATHRVRAVLGRDRTPRRSHSGRRYSLETYMTNQTYPFQLPPLPFHADALEPYFDARTMHIHHDEHHRVYVERLNGAGLPGSARLTISNLLRELNKVPLAIQTAVRTDGGGHLNPRCLELIGTPDQ